MALEAKYIVNWLEGQPIYSVTRIQQAALDKLTELGSAPDPTAAVVFSRRPDYRSGNEAAFLKAIKAVSATLSDGVTANPNLAAEVAVLQQIEAVATGVLEVADDEDSSSSTSA